MRCRQKKILFNERTRPGDFHRFQQDRQRNPNTRESLQFVLHRTGRLFLIAGARSGGLIRPAASDTHSRICSRVEIFLTSCQYKATIDSSAQFLIEFGMRVRLRISRRNSHQTRRGHNLPGFRVPVSSFRSPQLQFS